MLRLFLKAQAGGTKKKSTTWTGVGGGATLYDVETKTTDGQERIWPKKPAGVGGTRSGKQRGETAPYSRRHSSVYYLNPNKARSNTTS